MWCGGVEKPGEADMRMLVKDGEELKRYESNGAIGEGQGTKAGVTYRLGDGRMIYVPEEKEEHSRYRAAAGYCSSLPGRFAASCR